MHLFICWSGRRSRRMAEAFDSQWLPKVFGGRITSFVSFADIEKGEGWFERLLTELGKADAALVCLTPENLASPWMHFEAAWRRAWGKVGCSRTSLAPMRVRCETRSNKFN